MIFLEQNILSFLICSLHYYSLSFTTLVLWVFYRAFTKIKETYLFSAHDLIDEGKTKLAGNSSWKSLVVSTNGKCFVHGIIAVNDLMKFASSILHFFPNLLSVEANFHLWRPLVYIPECRCLGTILNIECL